MPLMKSPDTNATHATCHQVTNVCQHTKPCRWVCHLPIIYTRQSGTLLQALCNPWHIPTALSKAVAALGTHPVHCTPFTSPLRRVWDPHPPRHLNSIATLMGVNMAAGAQQAAIGCAIESEQPCCGRCCTILTRALQPYVRLHTRGKLNSCAGPVRVNHSML
jgi:hypothetical protein